MVTQITPLSVDSAFRPRFFVTIRLLIGRRGYIVRKWKLRGVGFGIYLEKYNGEYAPSKL